MKLPQDEEWQGPTEIPDGVDEPRDIVATLLKHKPKIKISKLPPLTLSEWEGRDLAPPDFLLGNWLSTTSRVLLSAATGLGKSNFSIALGMRVAAQRDFLHWRASRAGNAEASVLFIDGEMPRRLLKQRILDEEQRLGVRPSRFMALSREDVPDLQPLNSPQGQEWMDALIANIGHVDLIIFDNIMALLAGDMKDPESWQQTLPWALSLTGRTIGQLWIHHTGHDETRAYGDKSREWQLDTTIHLDAVKRDDTDLSFSLAFRKARERTPTTRFDFQDVRIALVDDRWRYELTDARLPGKISPQTKKALDGLHNVLAGDQVVSLSGGRRAAKNADWRNELALLGMIDPQKNAKSADTLFNRWRRDLVSQNHIACEAELSWPIA